MGLAKAVKIFKDINSAETTVEEKRLAIRKVLDMETHNGITKEDLLNALNWLWILESEG